MEQQTEKVILFPKWQKKLEKESLEALKQKRYDEALNKLDELIHYHVDHHEILIGRLICLMELNRLEDAIDFSEQLLAAERDEYYYHYFHIYLTILFQMSEYDILMDEVAQILLADDIPADLKAHFKQLCHMSGQMQSNIIEEKSVKYIHKLMRAIEEKNYAVQWQQVEQLRKLKYRPTAKIVSLLNNEAVHPVAKTAIFQMLQERQFSEVVEISKLNLHIIAKPSDIKEIKTHSIWKQTIFAMKELEQENPVLFELLQQVLYRYLYVRYPILLPGDEAIRIAEALNHIGTAHLKVGQVLDDEQEVGINRYIEEIKLCETLYLSVIEE